MGKSLKVAFLGIGSIGKKHLINLAKVLRMRGIDFEFDVIRSGRGKPLDSELIPLVNTVLNVDENISTQYDIMFVTNPTELHFSSIAKYSSHANHMFIEKPVFSSTDVRIEDLRRKEQGTYYVACPLRYSKVFQYVKNNVDYAGAFAVRAICSSYLPDWRPGVDYRETYSARRALGGGVTIDLIHEWDYLRDLYGKPDNIYRIIGKYSNLEIETEDCAVYIASCKNKAIELHLDYFGRKPIREVQFFLRSETVLADFMNSRVIFLVSGETVELQENKNAWYIREIEHFLDIVNGKVPNDNTIEMALETMRIAGGVL